MKFREYWEVEYLTLHICALFLWSVPVVVSYALDDNVSSSVVISTGFAIHLFLLGAARIVWWFKYRKQRS